MSNLDGIEEAIKPKTIKIKPPALTPNTNYHPGDIIEVIADHCSHGYKIGQTLTVKHIDTNKRIYVEDDSNYLNENDIKPAFVYQPYPSSPTPTPPSVNMNGQPYNHNPIKLQMENIKIDVKTLRQGLGLTQRELAKKAGMSQGTITRAENNLWISLTCLMRIADALGKKLTIN